MPVLTQTLNRRLKPLCPRDDHVMKYESAGSTLNVEHDPSYHCGFDGCPVRYDSTDGYYIVVGVDHRTYRLAEPGVNTLQCPEHGSWLYRQSDADTEAGTVWCCGVEGCQYCFHASTKGDWVRT